MVRMLLSHTIGGMAAAIAMAEAIQAIEAMPIQDVSPPGPKDRTVRGPALQMPEPWGNGGRQRAQWKDENQRRGRQR